MENILKSILQTEQEAEKLIADAKIAAQKISQDGAQASAQLKMGVEEKSREKVETLLSRVREEASLGKEKILAQAGQLAQGLDKQAEVNMSKAVTAALNRLLAG